MAYPTTLETFVTNKNPWDTRSWHAATHNDIGRLINALQAKLGITDSAVTTSVEYRLTNKVDKVTGKGLSENDYSDADKAKIDLITVSGAVDLDTISSWLSTAQGDISDLSSDKQNKIQYQSDWSNVGLWHTTLNFNAPLRASQSGWSIINVDFGGASPTEATVIADKVVPPDAVTFDEPEAGKYELTHTGTGYKEYYWTTVWARGYNHALQDANGKFILKEDLGVGVYDVGPPKTITYPTGVANFSTGVFSFTNGNAAYQNQANTFSKTNTFDGKVIFNGQVDFKYLDNTPDTWTFDADLANKQKFTCTTTGSHSILFKNIMEGATYTIGIAVEAGQTLTLTKSTDFTNDCGAINAMYQMWSTTFPLTLTAWAWILVCECFTTAIHVNKVPTVWAT